MCMIANISSVSWILSSFMQPYVRMKVTFAAVFILIVFSLHNAWNCICFLDFTNYGPAQELFNATSSDIGLVNTMVCLRNICFIQKHKLVVAVSVACVQHCIVQLTDEQLVAFDTNIVHCCSILKAGTNISIKKISCQ